MNKPRIWFIRGGPLQWDRWICQDHVGLNSCVGTGLSIAQAYKSWLDVKAQIAMTKSNYGVISSSNLNAGIAQMAEQPLCKR